MDRRYSQARGAVKTEQGEAIARRYLGRAKQINRSAQSYGGSAPRGSRSATPQAGLDMLLARAQNSADQRRIFDQAGRGELGGRAEFKRARVLPDGASSEA